MERGGRIDGGCIQPNAMFLVITLIGTAIATAMLCAAVMTEHWEHISWDRDKIASALNFTNKSEKMTVEWYEDGQVGKVKLLHKARRNPHEFTQVGVAYLIPMHGGIWTLCPALSEEQTRELSLVGYPAIPCFNYLAPTIRSEEPKPGWQHRMQNLSISCALVCLIILGSSALVGAFGILKHQISAVLVTGVMYLLAATFALFTLMIIHFKRHKRDCDIGQGHIADGVIPMQADHHESWQILYSGRMVTTGWSLDLGWAAVVTCAFASALWILLAKVMRYNPLTTLL